MIKPFLCKTGSATVNVQPWADLHILSTITWLPQHTNIILWAPDQISPPSRSLWAELWCQNPLLLLLLPVLSPPSHFKGSAWEFPPSPPSHPCSPAPLHACTETDFYNSPADPRGSRARRELGKVLFRSVNSRVRVRAEVFDLHTPRDRQLWASAKTASGQNTEWNEDGCLAPPKEAKPNWSEGCAFSSSSPKEPQNKLYSTHGKYAL